MWRRKIFSSLQSPQHQKITSLKSGKWKFPPPEYENVSIVCTNISRVITDIDFPNAHYCFQNVFAFRESSLANKMFWSQDQFTILMREQNSNSQQHDDDDLMKLIGFDWLWRTCQNIVVFIVLIMLSLVLNSVLHRVVSTLKVARSVFSFSPKNFTIFATVKIMLSNPTHVRRKF